MPRNPSGSLVGFRVEWIHFCPINCWSRSRRIPSCDVALVKKNSPDSQRSPGSPARGTRTREARDASEDLERHGREARDIAPHQPDKVNARGSEAHACGPLTWTRRSGAPAHTGQGAGRRAGERAAGGVPGRRQGREPILPWWWKWPLEYGPGSRSAQVGMAHPAGQPAEAGTRSTEMNRLSTRAATTERPAGRPGRTPRNGATPCGKRRPTRGIEGAVGKGKGQQESSLNAELCSSPSAAITRARQPRVRCGSSDNKPAQGSGITRELSVFSAWRPGSCHERTFFKRAEPCRTCRAA